MGLSQAWILKTFSKPHKWAQKNKTRLRQPKRERLGEWKRKNDCVRYKSADARVFKDALDFQQPARVQPSSGHTEAQAKL